jgi:hypothetical protein
MAYIIYNNDGSVLTTLSDGEVDVLSTSLTLLGKNVNNYGQYWNNNLVKLLTNSALGVQPLQPQLGQLWYNSSAKTLNVWNGAAFTSVSGANVSGTGPVGVSTGTMWYDTVNSQLKVWNGSVYKVIGPAVSSTYGSKFGIEPPTTSTIKEYVTNLPKDVGVIYSYGDALGLLTTASFVMSTASSYTFLNETTATTLIAGLTLRDDLDVKGNLYIDGVQQIPPVKTLTAEYDMSFWGNHFSGGSTSTRQTIIDVGNNFLRLNLLPMLFTTATETYGIIYSNGTTATFTRAQYPTGSEANVICKLSTYNTGTTVRRFVLLDTLGTSNRQWQPRYLLNPNGSFSTSTYTSHITNIVLNAD